MMPAAILILWAATGILASATLRDGDPNPWGWAPIAAILGPLWIAVALDQRGTHQLEVAIVPDDARALDEYSRDVP